MGIGVNLTTAMEGLLIDDNGEFKQDLDDDGFIKPERYERLCATQEAAVSIDCDSTDADPEDPLTWFSSAALAAVPENDALGIIIRTPDRGDLNIVVKRHADGRISIQAPSALLIDAPPTEN